jgi:hypothetical protein
MKQFRQRSDGAGGTTPNGPGDDTAGPPAAVRKESGKHAAFRSPLT